MKIGLSLSPNLLTGKPIKEQEKKLLSTFNGITGFLSELKSRNVSSIEIRTILPNTEECQAKEAIDTVLSYGFNISIHGKLIEIGEDTFKSCYPALDYLLRKYKQYQDKLIVVIHAFTSYETGIDELVNNSVTALQKWLLHTKAESLSFAVEINRAKEGRNDSCTTSEGVLRIVDRIEDSRVGICFDMGHTYYNIQRDPKYYEITEAFLKKVIHTHIHGLGEGGTHCTLTPEDSLPLVKFLKMLNSVSYDGIYNLELSFEKFSMDNVAKELINSIDKLSALSHI